MKASRILMALVALMIVAGMTANMATAQATTKSLATNYTLVNLSPNDTTATVNYYLPDGSQWKAPDSIPVAGNGGQAIVRQYLDPDLTPGAGSAVVSSLEPLAGLVQQVVAPGVAEVPTSGAYVAISQGSSKFYIPQVAKNGSSATGTANSWIIIQNMGAAAVDVDVIFTKYGAATPAHTETITGIAMGASYYYDLNLETQLTENGFYSAVVDAGTGTIGVVSNLFFGADSMMSFNAFAQEALTGSWSIPLVYSRLPNSLVTSLVVQNLSGVEIPVGDVTLACTPDAASVDQSTITNSNTAAIPAGGIIAWNTLTQTTIFPTNWQGPCTVTSATDKGIVGIVLYRYTANPQQAGYEAVPSSSADTTVFVPLIARQLSNKFCTTITVMNLSAADITVDLTWKHTGGTGADVAENDVAIAGKGSLIRNLCISSGLPAAIPATWVGTLTAVGTGPVAAYVANRYNPASGDQFMAYLGITQ